MVDWTFTCSCFVRGVGAILLRLSELNWGSWFWFKGVLKLGWRRKFWSWKFCDPVACKQTSVSFRITIVISLLMVILSQAKCDFGPSYVHFKYSWTPVSWCILKDRSRCGFCDPSSGLQWYKKQSCANSAMSAIVLRYKILRMCHVILHLGFPMH